MQRVADRNCVMVIDPPTRFAVLDLLPDAGQITGKNRQTCPHGLQDRDRQPFMVGEQHEELGVRQELGHVVDVAGDTDRRG